MRSVIKRFALLASSVTLTLFCAEVVLRLTTDEDFGGSPPDCSRDLFGPLPWLAFDPVFGWRNRADLEPTGCDPGNRPIDRDARINAHGFRGAEIEPSKPPGTIRIVCMGDSGTFGVQSFVNEAEPSNPIFRAVDNYPEELARRLERENFEHVEVINAGVIGHSTSHGLRLLILRVLELDPDIVTVRYGANDSLRSWAPQRRTLEPENGFARALLYELHDWKLARLGLGAYQSVPSLHPEPHKVWWSTDARFRRNLERMLAVTRKHDVRLLVVDTPIHYSAIHRRSALRRLRALQTLQSEFASEHGVPRLTTKPYLSNPYDRYYDSSDAVHPNQRGARLIGELLFEELRRLGWLDPIPRVSQ
jgi:lysophospholipase L1-like esterase